MADIYYYMGNSGSDNAGRWTEVFLLADVETINQNLTTKITCKKLIFSSGGGYKGDWSNPYNGGKNSVVEIEGFKTSSESIKKSFNVNVDGWTPSSPVGSSVVDWGGSVKSPFEAKCIYAPFDAKSTLVGNKRLEGETTVNYQVEYSSTKISTHEFVFAEKEEFDKKSPIFEFVNSAIDGNLTFSLFFTWQEAAHDVPSFNGGTHKFGAIGTTSIDVSPHMLIVGDKPGESGYAPSTTMSSIRLYVEKDPAYYADVDYLKIKCIPLDSGKQGTTINHYNLTPIELNGRSVCCIELAQDPQKSAELEGIPVETIAQASIDYLSKYSLTLYPFSNDTALSSNYNNGSNSVVVNSIVVQGPTILPTPIPENRVRKAKISYPSDDEIFCELDIKMGIHVSGSVDEKTGLGNGDAYLMYKQGIALTTEMVDKVKIWVTYKNELGDEVVLNQEGSFYESTTPIWEDEEIHTTLSWTLNNTYRKFQLYYEVTTHNATYYTPSKIVISEPIPFTLSKSDGTCTYVKVGDEWKTGVPYVKINDSYKTVTQAFIKVNGEWKTIL